MTNKKPFVVDTTVEVNGSFSTGEGVATHAGKKYTVEDLFFTGNFRFTDNIANDITGFEFGDSGNKIYFVDTSNIVRGYQAHAPYKIQGLTSLDQTFTLDNDLNTETKRVRFKSDGYKMYGLSRTNNVIYQYSLSTAWDVSTASSDSKSLDFSSEETTPNDFRFKPDGTSVYVSGDSGDAVFQYNLSTAWDISTATYSSNSLSATNIDSFSFNSTGTKLFVTGGITFQQYSLSTAWDISTATEDTLTGKDRLERYWGDTSLRTDDFSFSGDGSTLVNLTLGSNDKLREYAHYQTTLDLSTGNHFKHTVEFGAKVEFFTFENVGSSQTFTLEITQGPCRPVDFAKLSELGNYEPFPMSEKSGLTDDTNPRDMALSVNGDRMYVVGDSTNSIRQYDLAFNYAPSSATHVGQLSISGEAPDCRAMTFKTDGTRVFVTDYSASTTKTVSQRDLPDAWDVTTAGGSTVTSVNLNSDIQSVQGIRFKPDGTKMFLLGTTTGGGADIIVEYSLSTAWDISSTLTLETTYDTARGTAKSFDITQDGSFMFVLDSDEELYMYFLSTPWDMSTAVYSRGIVYMNPTAETAIYFSYDNRYFYELDDNGTSFTVRCMEFGTEPRIYFEDDITWTGVLNVPGHVKANKKSKYSFTTADGGQTYVGTVLYSDVD